MSLFRRYPLVAFFAIAYLISWSTVPFGLFFTPGPLIAALIVVPLTQGRAGLRHWARRLIRWRVAWPWYALAVAVPLAVQAATFGLTRSLAPDSPSSLSQLAPLSVVLVLGVRLINPLDGPLAEEPGWRAYAQPELQRRRSALAATAILALLVACWHLPLWLLPQFGATPADIASDFIGTIAVTFWYAWLFNHSGGSALITLISHAVEGTIHPQLFWTDPAVMATTTWLYSAAWCVVAAGIIIADLRFWRSVGYPATAPTPSQPSVEAVSHVSQRESKSPTS
jgi:membrane protease YdiL (CAAX protease family)